MNSYEVKFLVRVSVETEGDIAEASSYTHIRGCEAVIAIIDDGHAITVTDLTVEWLETDQEDEEGECIRRIDTGGEVDI
jgi:hypothetical protein